MPRGVRLPEFPWSSIPAALPARLRRGGESARRRHAIKAVQAEVPVFHLMLSSGWKTLEAHVGSLGISGEFESPDFRSGELPVSDHRGSDRFE